MKDFPKSREQIFYEDACKTIIQQLSKMESNDILKVLDYC